MNYLDLLPLLVGFALSQPIVERTFTGDSNLVFILDYNSNLCTPSYSRPCREQRDLYILLELRRDG